MSVCQLSFFLSVRLSALISAISSQQTNMQCGWRWIFIKLEGSQVLHVVLAVPLFFSCPPAKIFSWTKLSGTGWQTLHLFKKLNKHGLPDERFSFLSEIKVMKMQLALNLSLDREKSFFMTQLFFFMTILIFFRRDDSNLAWINRSYSKSIFNTGFYEAAQKNLHCFFFFLCFTCWDKILRVLCVMLLGTQIFGSAANVEAKKIIKIKFW